jgi:undecaprenyl diphosphate synthase
MKLSIFERFLCAILEQGAIPRHIAFIMDGNRRFAKRRGQSAIEGHKLGVESLKKCLLICLTLKVEIATLFAFAIENFNRPQVEVQGLMELTKRSFV